MYNMRKSNIQIFLSYHKPSTLLKSNVFVPIHVGRAIERQKSDFESKWLSDNLIGDDIGDNISSKNLNYCELTAQYWAWKNLSSEIEYVGFMHYRRHLNFATQVFPENNWGLIEKEFLDAVYIDSLGLNDENIQNTVQQYDVITAKKWDVTCANSKNNFDHYANSDSKLHIKDYELALDILKEKYPEYCDTIEKYNAMHYGYYTNIFVMRRDIFNRYSEWLFSILFELEKRVDISAYDYQEARIFGYISEWLFGIFVTHLQDTTNLKVKELQRTIVENTDVQVPVNICFASDDNYAKYMGVAIASILANKTLTDEIHIYVLDGGISDKMKRKIEDLKSIAPFSIQYLNIDECQFKDFPLRGSDHFSVVTWFRLFLPSVLPNINKLLYLDCDIVVNKSLWPLYNSDLANNYVCGVIDIMNEANCKRLKLSKYVSAGVLLFNLKKLREDSIQEKFYKYVDQNREKILWNDQDVINAVCNEGIEYIDPLWNVQITSYNGNKSNFFRENVSQAYILHFVSNKKPWKGRYSKYDKYYYKYVIITPWWKDIVRFYISYVLSKILLFLRFIFTLENVDNGRNKQLRLFGLSLKFPRDKSKWNKDESSMV